MRTQAARLAVVASAALVASGCVGVAVEDDGGTGGGTAGAGGGAAASLSVLEHHGGPSRQGLYLEPTFTRAAMATLHLDATFSAAPSDGGQVYAQPLYLDRGVGGRDAVLVATEGNVVFAFDADGGAQLWRTFLAPPGPRAGLPCGNISPSVGVTGTPVADPRTRTVYLDAMTSPDTGTTFRHQVFALDLDSGAVKPGWPVDLQAALGSLTPAFDSSVQNQRGALALIGGVLYVPFGGHYGDCGAYRGWVVGLSTTAPGTVTSFHTAAPAGGIWSPSGVVSDGQHLFVATGNTSTGSTWGGGDGVYRLDPGPTWPGGTAEYWAPSDWKSLDDADLDTSTALLVDAPGSTPSALVAAFGKNGVGYLLDRANLGGVGGEKSQRQLSGEINGAAVTYASDAGTFVVVRAEGPGVACTGGTSGNLVAMTVGPAAGIVPAWCAGSATPGVPIATMSSPGQDPLVWEVSQGSSLLHVFDGLTGAELHTGSTALAGVSYFNTPIVAKGRVFVAGSRVYAFRP